MPSKSTAISHVGKSSRRLTQEADNPREVAFAELWARQNEVRPSLRYGTLELLLHSEGDGWLRGDLTQEEATAAATIIQWLGSNVGWSFLNEAVGKCGFKIVEAKHEPVIAGPQDDRACYECGYAASAHTRPPISERTGLGRCPDAEVKA